MQLINLQSNEEFASHMLNRDTWTHSAVEDIIKATFIFWQVTCRVNHASPSSSCEMCAQQRRHCELVASDTVP